jgi:hypothetical protein
MGINHIKKLLKIAVLFHVRHLANFFGNQADSHTPRVML